MDAIRYKPRAFYPLGENANDISGYAKHGSRVGAANWGISLASSVPKSLKGSTNTYFSTSVSNVYSYGRERESFSLSAVVYPIINTTGSGISKIVSHQSLQDGLYISGTTIYFSTIYTGTGDATVSYDLGFARKADVVGVHTYAKNSLYVDGVMVAEIDITQPQQLDFYHPNANASFVSGTSTNSNNILINNVGFFSRALQPEDIASMHRGNNRRPEGMPGKPLGGLEVPMGRTARPAFIDTAWRTATDWAEAELINVVVDGDALHGMKQDGLTIGGTWTDSVDLYTGETAVPINSMSMWWEGVNVQVETSVNGGASWSVAQKGRNLSTISTGFNPTNTNLLIRVTFYEGHTDAYIDEMTITGYTSNTALINNRNIFYSNPVSILSDVVAPASLRDDQGIRIGSGGSINIGADTSSPIDVIRTVEIWAKPDVSWNASLGLSGSDYQNGGTINGSSVLPANEWTVLHKVLSSDYSGAININLVGLLGKVVFYDRALSSEQILSIYNNYIGYDKFVESDPSSIGVAEAAPTTENPSLPLSFYALSWAVSSA